MKSIIFFLISFVLLADKKEFKPALVNFDSYEALVSEVKNHRSSRLVNLDEFNNLAKEKNVVILDTRTKELFQGKHIKGALHLNFSAFTVRNLRRLIPNPDTKILIYCNNNFENDQVFFATKAAPILPSAQETAKTLTLALNIPTYINLYGYGYKNVYELSELVSVNDPRLELDGDSVSKKQKK